MMSSASRYFAELVSIFGLLCGAYGQSAPAPAGVGIALEKATISEHEPVILDIKIQSPPSTEVNFDPGYDWENVQIKVVDPNGRSQERSREPLREGMRFGNSVHIPAGTTETVSLLVNDWFSFKEQGFYQIDLVLRGIPSEPFAPSARLRLHVEQRDEGMLKTTCSDLLVRINSSNSFRSSLVAAKALSAIDDPLAVPYIVAAMKRREFVSLMTGALARLNTRASVDALVDASKSQDPETSNLARSALASLRH